MMLRVRRSGCAVCSFLGLILLASVAQADVFPNPSIAENSRSGTDRYNGLKKILMMVVTDVDSQLSSSQFTSRVNTLRSREEDIREFYATNSGGKFDFYYEDIIATPINLNDDNTRPSDFWSQAQTVATSLGKNLGDYYMFAYDISSTTNDTGWAGLSTSNRIYLQSISTSVTQHEIGHQVGADHAKAFRQLNDSNFHPYTFNPVTQQYQPYTPGGSPYNPVPFGVASYEYANPFDTMGNSSTGDFRIREKVGDLQWIPASQLPRVDGASGLGEGVHRIYAHDELQAVTNAEGEFGVTQGYATGVNYGLTYNRLGQDYDSTDRRFEAVTQTIDIEYRSGADGAYFYLDGTLVDLDSDTSNLERLLEVGRSIEDINMGMSTFIVDAGQVGQDTPSIDFMAFNPPAPSILASSWWNITAVATGVDSIGSWIDLQFERVSALNDIAGDLNQDGDVDELDLNLFISGWRTDTLNMSSIDKYRHGDMNFDGITDLNDAYLLRQALITAGASMADFASYFGQPVPEPSSVYLMVLVGIAVGTLSIRRKRGSLI
ncbi:dockerin type I domain-containing protein [Aeoliella sp. SH292]|uniref:dockerin type I domain-containing protein n=1 Tax=Aeoliella sp. SH292 TaxID=3454464 RepID=UPI003F969B0E